MRMVRVHVEDHAAWSGGPNGVGDGRGRLRITLASWTDGTLGGTEDWTRQTEGTQINSHALNRFGAANFTQAR